MRIRTLVSCLLLSFAVVSTAMAADLGKPLTSAQYEAALAKSLSDLKKAESNPAEYANQLAKYNELNTEYKKTLSLMTK